MNLATRVVDYLIKHIKLGQPGYIRRLSINAVSRSGSFVPRFHVLKIHILCPGWREHPLNGSWKNDALISHIYFFHNFFSFVVCFFNVPRVEYKHPKRSVNL